METNPETDGPISHLDFTLTCSVGHPGGSQHAPDGTTYSPCTTPARFVTDVHDHPEPSTHFWCAEHLSVHALWIQHFLAANTRSICLGCGLHLTELEDLIFNLQIITTLTDDE